MALDFVEQHEGFQYTPEQERAVVRKIDMWLMPLVRMETLELHMFILYESSKLLTTY